MRRKTLCLSWMFFALGFGGGTFASRLIDLRERLGLQHRSFGLVMLLGSVGSILAAMCLPWLLRHLSISRLLFAGAFAFYLLMPAVTLSPAVFLLALGLLGQNAASSLFNVSMNKMAVLVEKERKSPIMARFHGICSLGALLGSVTGGFCLASAVPAAYHVIGTAIGLLLGTIVAATLIRQNDYPEPQQADKKQGGSLPAPARRQLIAMAFTVAAGTLCEGAMSQWSGVYLREHLHASLTTASWAVSASTGASLVMRLLGSAFLAKVAPRKVVTLGNVAIVGGFVALIASPNLPAAFASIICIGLGVASVAPLMFRAASDVVPEQADFALAQMTNACYAGALVGPPIIGWFASVSSLQAALAFPGALATIVVFLSPFTWATARNSSRRKG